MAKKVRLKAKISTRKTSVKKVTKQVLVTVDDDKVSEVVKKVLQYSKSKSRKNKKNNFYPLWYAGISNLPNIRIVGHKSKLKVKALPTFKAFDAGTFANARAVEECLCKNHKFQHCERTGGANKDNHVSPSKFAYIYFIPAQLRKK